jgi:hypothetical protein
MLKVELLKAELLKASPVQCGVVCLGVCTILTIPAAGKSQYILLCIVELHVTVNIKILTVAQQCFYGEYTLPATINILMFSCKLFLCDFKQI